MVAVLALARRELAGAFWLTGSPASIAS